MGEAGRARRDVMVAVGRAMAIAVAVAITLMRGAAPASAQDAGPPWTIVDPTGETTPLRPTLDSQLNVLAFSGWPLHIVVLDRPGPIGDPADLVPPIPSSPDTRLAEGTLALVMAQPDGAGTREWLIAGDGGREPEGRAADIGLAVRDTVASDGGDGDEAVRVFVDAVADEAGVDISLDGAEDTADDDPSPFVGILTGIAIVVPILTAAFLLHAYLTRHRAPKLSSLGGLAPGQDVAVDGTIWSDAAFAIPETGAPAVFARWVTQRKEHWEQVTSTKEVGRDEDTRYVEETVAAREGSWTDAEVRREASVPFVLTDGTTTVAIQGPGHFEGSLVHEGPTSFHRTRGRDDAATETRDVVYAIPLGAEAAVKGHVHQGPNGSLVIGAGGAASRVGLEVTTAGTATDIVARRLYGAAFCLAIGIGLTVGALLLRGALGG